ncbi:hypothetical protein V1525DRAFT_408233 [Lipomyces kononenkoae]|uniref:Uncharacterized protein n=1 Tax=Lipomyces kononenkoae TaxID=34357 RepID=A0ACC3SXB2_LIPKO
MQILDLPVELLQTIACYLPTQDLPSFALTCSNFNRSLDCGSLWDSRIHHDYCHEGMSYSRMILSHYNHAHQWNITLRQICIALHAAWSTTCREGTWQVGFKQSPRRCREHSIPEYWVQISRRMRVPPGRYDVRCNFETTEECLGQIVFQIAMDDDGETENTDSHADRNTDENQSDAAAAVHTDQEDNKDEVQLIDNVDVHTEPARPNGHGRTTSDHTAHRVTTRGSAVLCDTALPRAIVTRAYKQTTLNHQGTEVKIGDINIPKTAIKRREWRDITISLEMQGGWNANMKPNYITLCPIQQDTPIDSSSTPKLEHSSPRFGSALAERCRRAFNCFGGVADGCDATFDTIVNSLKMVVGN